MLNPRIYVASLSDYNAGTLHGVWIDLIDSDVDDVNRQIADMLASSPEGMATGIPAEEWAVHDHDGFGGLTVPEWPDLEQLHANAQVLNGPNGEALALFADYEGVAADSEELEGLEDEVTIYEGRLKEVAEDLFFDLYEVPEHIAPYVDTDRFANDLSYEGWTEIQGYTFHHHG